MSTDTEINARNIAATELPDDSQLDLSLRPQALDDYVGQEGLKENLRIFMAAAQQRSEPLEHILLYGPPGLGKTTLAHIIAKEMGVQLRITSGPALERTGDLAAILTNLQPGDVLFIDEIHRMNKMIEEVLYPAMEDFALDLVVGKGPAARTLRLSLPKFTIIGATTKMAMLSSPLRDRFGSIFRLNFYEPEEIARIIHRNAALLRVDIQNDAVQSLARRARRTPRIANRLLKRVRDFAQVRNNGIISVEACQQALQLMDIDDFGLDQVDRRLLLTMIEKFGGGPVGLNTLAAATAEEMETIEDVYEPFLMQIGFIQRTSRGRQVTPLGYEHLGRTSPTASLL